MWIGKIELKLIAKFLAQEREEQKKDFAYGDKLILDVLYYKCF